MGNLKLWVWLTSKKFITPEKITALLSHYDNIEEIYEADRFENVEGIGLREKRDLLNKSLDTAERIIEKVKTLGARIVTIEDENYPKPLREIEPPPYILYMKGEDIDFSEGLPIGVVGSRECSDYGRVAAEHLSYEMAAAGVTIVSGMARGIDSIAAVSALKAGGKTVAVLGSGIDIVYPPENEDLMRAIEKNGLVITEYPPSCPPWPHNFPKRNRIISGLSKGLLVIEAGKPSGTFSTVEYAKNYGKEIFALPGGIFRDNSQGTNEMIKKGAILTTSIRDIFERFPLEASGLKRTEKKSVIVRILEKRALEKKKRKNQKNKPEPIKEERTPINISIDDSRFGGLNEREKKVLEPLLKNTLHIDESARETSMDIRELNSILPVLEMMGYINKIEGNKYKINI